MPLTLRSSQCRGFFDRGTPDQCPPGYLSQFYNFMVRNGFIIPRPGMVTRPVGRTKVNIQHLSIYKPSPVAGIVTPALIGHQGGGPPAIFNMDLGGAGTLIYNSTQNYHSWINFYGRGYFSLHDTNVGSATENLQVYEGAATTRNAAGLKPVSAMLGAAAVGGNLGVGTYLVDVVYVTTTGFITKPSGNVLAKNCFGGYKIDLTVIPIGPAGTFGRKIIMTKSIPLGTYTGNPNDYEFFFAPNAFIQNNVATTFALSEFDGNLISSSDYLFNLLETIPSGVGVGDYNSRLLVYGENANPSIIRISAPGDPETIDAISNLLIVDPSESDGLKNSVTLRGNLYLFKSYRMYVTSDNGGSPSTWQVDTFDSGVGTECYGVSAVLDAKGTHMNQYVIASRSGLILFDGILRFPELTYNVENTWRDIDQDLFAQVELVMNPVNKHIYCIIPRNDGSRTLLVGDYSEGLGFETIKWSIWEHASGHSFGDFYSIVTSIETGVPVIYVSNTTFVGSLNINNPSAVDSTFGLDTAFPCKMQSAPLVFGENEIGYQAITSVNLMQANGGPGEISVTGISLSDVPSSVLLAANFFPFLSIGGKAQGKFLYTPFFDMLPGILINAISTSKPKIMKVIIDGYLMGEQ